MNPRDPDPTEWTWWWSALLFVTGIVLAWYVWTFGFPWAS